MTSNKDYRYNMDAPIYGISRHRILRDGQGIVTLVALSGCPLRCLFCLNPHCIDSASGNFQIMTPRDLLQELLIDDLYFRTTGGGITFGGGEPLLYASFINSFSEICPNEWKIRIETSLNVPNSNLKLIADMIDGFIVDIKDLNDNIYYRYTNHHNQQVVDNLKYLAEGGFQSKVLIRLPIIPNFNSTKNIEASQKKLMDMGFYRFDRFNYTNTLEERPLNADECITNSMNWNKITCEALKRVRSAMANHYGINFTPAKCDVLICTNEPCPACEAEMKWLTKVVFNEVDK